MQSDVTSTAITSPVTSCRLSANGYSIVVVSLHPYLSSVVSDGVNLSLRSGKAEGESSGVDDKRHSVFFGSFSDIPFTFTALEFTVDFSTLT